MSKDDLSFEENDVQKSFTEAEAKELIKDIDSLYGTNVVFYVEDEPETTLEIEELEREHKGKKGYLSVLAVGQDCRWVKPGDKVIPKFLIGQDGQSLHLPVHDSPLIWKNCVYIVISESMLIAKLK